MQIIFESRDAAGNSLREQAIERVRFVFRRMSAVVPMAKVQFCDVNGPRGGIDKRCQVELSTDALGTVVIASLARDWRTALDRSLGRASRVLARNLHRQQRVARRSALVVAGSAQSLKEGSL